MISLHINKENHEGYSDPTAYEALTNIQREDREKRYAHRTHRSFLPMVYICSPYAGETETNLERARRYCRFALSEGCIPIAPHLLFPQFMDDTDPKERSLAMHMNMVLLSKCSELWVFGSQVSSGMGVEIRKAKAKGKKVRHFTIGCKEVFS